VVIHDLYIVDAIIFPHETYPPLVVYSDAVLAATIALEQLQLVAGRYLQCSQLRCSLQHQQLAPGYPFNIFETGNRMAEKETLGIGAGK
jgi:hypothetical protein